MFGSGSPKLVPGSDYKVRVSVGTDVFGRSKVWDYDARYVPDRGDTHDSVKKQMSAAALERCCRENGCRPRDLCVVGFSIDEM